MMVDFEIICGDCLVEMAKMADNSVDAVITDPPYSSGTRREAAKGLRKSMRRGMDDGDWFGSDCLTTNGFLWLMRSFARESKRILIPGGHILSFIDWRMMPALAGAMESADLRHVGLLVWDKTYFGMGAYFRNQHELIVHFSNGKTRPTFRHDIGNVLSVPPVRNSDHGTEKPVKLMEALISVVTDEGETILDPFCGSGSTGKAAIELGRRFIGMDIEERWCNVARERLSTAQLGMLLEASDDA